ncbi:TPA_asm: maturation protein, partial [ssRNA phage SRR7976325_4]
PIHRVTVEDPWFGQFVFCIFSGYWPTFYIGPLSQRVIRNESIQNARSPVVTYNGLREKVVSHHYWEGNVSGSSAGGETSKWPIVSRNGGSLDMTEGNYYSLKVTHYDITCSEGNGYVDITVSGTQRWYTAGVEDKWISPIKKKATIRLRYERDPYNGSSTCKGPAQVSCSDPNWISATITSSPMQNAGNDSMDVGIRSVEYWLDKAFQPSKDERLPDDTTRSDAVFAALKSVSLTDINGLNDFNDLANPLGSLATLASHFKGMTDLRGFLKGFANFHLFWKYVVGCNILTAKDCSNLMKYLSGGLPNLIDKFVNQDLIGRGRSTRTIDSNYGTIDLIWNAKLVIGSPWTPMGVFQRFQQLGLAPTFGNIWDCLPYSFVVDWIVPIQDSIDNAMAIFSTLESNVKYHVLSRKVIRKVSRPFSSGGHTFNLNVRSVDYYRVVDGGLPSGLRLTPSVRLPSESQALTGLALIGQRVL